MCLRSGKRKHGKGPNIVMETETQRTHAKGFPISKNRLHSVSSLPRKLTSLIHLLILGLEKSRVIGNTSTFWESIEWKSS